jgi:hypothetical protein
MIGIPRNAQAPLEETFLKRALAGGDISVAELEESARSAGLLASTITSATPRDSSQPRSVSDASV